MATTMTDSQRQAERNIVRAGMERGLTEEQIRSAVVKYRQSHPAAPAEEPAAAPAQPDAGAAVAKSMTPVTGGIPGLGGNPLESLGDIKEGLGEAFGVVKERGKQLLEEGRQLVAGEQDYRTALFQVKGTIAGGAQDIAGVGLKTGGKLLMSAEQEEQAKAKVDELLQTPEGQQAMEFMGKGMAKWQEFRESNPELAKDIESVANLAGLIGEGYLAKETARGALGVARGTQRTAAAAGEGVAAAGEAVSEAATGVKYAAGQKFRDITGETAKREAAKAPLMAGETEAVTATRKLAQTGEVVTDPVGKEVVKQGVPEADVALIKEGSDIDRQKMQKMLETRKRQRTNEGVMERASDVAGDTVVDIGRFVRKTNKAAGRELDDVAKGLRGQSVDVNGPLDDFGRALDDAGVNIRDGKLDFDGSDFEGVPGAEKALNNIWKRIQKVVETGDAYEAHRLKRYIDENISYGKKVEGISGNLEAKLRDLRRGVDEVLDRSFDDYNRLNTIYSETVGALDELRPFLGKIGIDELVAGTKLGTVLRRIFSNTQTRADLIKALDNLQAVARKNGMTIDEDIVKQAKFVDILEKHLGTEAPTSILGALERARGPLRLAQAGQQLARGQVVGAAASGAAAAADIARGVSPEKLIKALEELVGSPSPSKAAREALMAPGPGAGSRGGEFNPFARKTPGEKVTELADTFKAKTGSIETPGGRIRTTKLKRSVKDLSEIVRRARRELEPSEFKQFLRSIEDDLTPAVRQEVGITEEMFRDPLRRQFGNVGQKRVKSWQELPRDRSLTGADDELQEASLKMAVEKEDEILEQYFEKHGKVINADSFRPYFVELGYNGKNAAAVQEASSYLSKRAWSEILKDEGDVIVATAGGSGAGKSSALKNIPGYQEVVDEATAVLDSNFSGYSSALKKMQEAVDAGKGVSGWYVYRDPMDAFVNGVIKRALENADEMGRIVPSKIVAANTIDSWKVINNFTKRHGIEFNVVDNSLGKNMAEIVDPSVIEGKMGKWTKESLTKEFNKTAKRLWKEDKIPKEMYEALIK